MVKSYFLMKSTDTILSNTIWNVDVLCMVKTLVKIYIIIPLAHSEKFTITAKNLTIFCEIFSPIYFILLRFLANLNFSPHHILCQHLKQVASLLFSALFLLLPFILQSFDDAGPHSAVGNVSGYRCVSDCRSRGREFDPGPAPYFCGD